MALLEEPIKEVLKLKNYIEELVALYKKGALNFKINFRKLGEVNEVLDDLGKGAILGRTVIIS